MQSLGERWRDIFEEGKEMVGKVCHCVFVNLSTFTTHCFAPQVLQPAHLSKWNNNDAHDCVLNAATAPTRAVTGRKR